MAKQAKSPAIEISDKRAREFLASVLDHLESIEFARGAFMNQARREREQIVAQHEALAALGISQKISKLIVKIACANEKIRGWQSELEVEELKIATKLAKAIGDKRQMSFWNDLAPASKPRKARAVKSNVVPMSPEIEATQGAA